MKFLSSPKLKQIPQWLSITCCTAVGGIATLVLSSQNAAAVLAVTTASAGASAALISEQEKRQKISQVTLERLPSKPLSSIVAGEEAEQVNTHSQLSAYLEAKNIKLESYRLPQELDVSSDRIALFMGSRYPSIKNFYKTIKRNLSTGKKFHFRLGECSQQEIANSTQLGVLLYQSSFLSQYRYFKQDKVIAATTQPRGDMINFLTGEWFERYIFQEVARLLSDNRIPYDFLINSKIRFLNGDGFELDLLFLVKQDILWIECKTKPDISDALARYSKHKKIMSIPENRAFVVALDIPDNQALELTQRWQITVVNQNNFLEKLAQSLGLDLKE